jgi:hypothetical protein
MAGAAAIGIGTSVGQPRTLGGSGSAGIFFGMTSGLASGAGTGTGGATCGGTTTLDVAGGTFTGGGTSYD